MRPSILGLALFLSLPFVAFAHSGRTNAQGCHKDNINGGRHCHNGGQSTVPAARPVRIPPTAPATKPPTLRTHVTEEVGGYQEWTLVPTRPQRVEPNPQPVEPNWTDTGGSEQPLFYFRNCAEARSFDAAPLRTVREGYRIELDPNRNGVACEAGE